MGKSAPIIPAWIKSLDALIGADLGVRAMCTACPGHLDIDLLALREKVGGAYSLFNRRCACRITPGCGGWNRFYCMKGMAQGMWDDATAHRWAVRDAQRGNGPGIS